MINRLNNDADSGCRSQAFRDRRFDGLQMHRGRNGCGEIPISEVRAFLVEPDEPLPFIPRIQLFRKDRRSVGRLRVWNEIVKLFVSIASEKPLISRDDTQPIKSSWRGSNVDNGYSNHVSIKIISGYNGYVRSYRYSKPWTRPELLPDLDRTDNGRDHGGISSRHISDCHFSNIPALLFNYCSLNYLQLTSCSVLQGVPSIFQALQGTGGGSAAQDSMNIDFSNDQVPQCL